MTTILFIACILMGVVVFHLCGQVEKLRRDTDFLTHHMKDHLTSESDIWRYLLTGKVTSPEDRRKKQ